MLSCAKTLTRREVNSRRLRYDLTLLAGSSSRKSVNPKGVNNMKMMTRILIVGLILGGAVHLSADTAEADEITLDTPITSIELNAEGKVARTLFSTGEELSGNDLYLTADEIKGREIGGVRRLPFEVVKDPASGKLQVIVPPTDVATSVKLPEGADATITALPPRVSYEGGGGGEPVAYGCPFPCHIEAGKCKCCPPMCALRAEDLDVFRFPALVEVDSEVKLLELPPE
jgi:hypothetical protein